MTGILSISFYFGTQTFVFLIGFFGVGIVKKNTNSFIFQKQSTLVIFGTKLCREMRCFISKDLDVKMRLWEILSILRQMICTQGQRAVLGQVLDTRQCCDPVCL